MTDQQLVRQVAGRDPRALEQLYDRYSRPVYSLLLRMTHEPAAAEDLLQEVFLRLWRYAPGYDAARGSFSNWILTVARNLVLDQMRSKAEKQRRREQMVDMLPAGDSVLPRSEERIDQRRQLERVRAVISGLPAGQQQALKLAYFGGLSQSEIAETMNEPLGTVKTWVRSALLRLREELEAVSQ